MDLENLIRNIGSCVLALFLVAIPIVFTIVVIKNINVLLTILFATGVLGEFVALWMLIYDKSEESM